MLGDLADDEIALWRHLTATRHELRSPFFSFEFARAVADAGARARVCLLYEHGSLAGFFPFQFSGGLTQAMAAGERIGGDLNDFCGVVIDRSRHPGILTQDLLRSAGLLSIKISHLEEHQRQLGLRGNTPSHGARIKLVSDSRAYWDNVKSAHRSDYDTLRRRERKVEREFRSVDLVFDDARVGELLGVVLAEKRKQYARNGDADGFAEPWKLLCLNLIARYCEGRCLPVLSTLYFDGEWAALHFGVRAGNVLHYWFPVYNPKFGNLSPGLILLAGMIRDAVGHGVEEIDLGEGLSRYKELFATGFYPVHRDEWYRATPRGLAYRGYRSLNWQVRALVRLLSYRWAALSN